MWDAGAWRIVWALKSSGHKNADILHVLQLLGYKYSMHKLKKEIPSIMDHG